MRKFGCAATIAFIGGVILAGSFSSLASTRTVTTTNLARPAPMDQGAYAATIDKLFSGAAMWR